jgi:hypothetical protein
VLLVAAVAGCSSRQVSVEERLSAGPSRFVVPDAVVTLAPPSYPSVAGWGVSPDGLVVEIDLDDNLLGRGRYTFGADGSVVRAVDESVFISRGDVTTWAVPAVELREFLGQLDAVQVRTDAYARDDTILGPSKVQVSYWIAGGERIFETTAPEVVAVAREMTSRPETGVRRWVPREIGFLAGLPNRTARSPLGPGDPFARWPLARGIRELARGAMPNAYGEQKLAICLHGRAAREVWTLFTGVNSAYLRVDDGRRWELESYVTLPGYRLRSSPCFGGTAPN